MEELQFHSEEEKKIFRQLIGSKEAIKMAFVQQDMTLAEGQMQKVDRMLLEMEKRYSLAIYDLEEPSRMKRLCGRVFGKIFKLLFMGPFAKKQVAYNRQMLNLLTEMHEMQEGMLEILSELKKEQEESR